MVLLAGCGSSSNDAGGTKETKTCSSEMSGMKMDITVSGENDKTETVNIKASMTSSLFNNIDFTTISDEQKEQMGEAMLTQLGIKEGDGVTVKNDFQKDSYTVDIGVDFTKTSKEVLAKIGFEDVNMKISDYVKEAEASGATCK